MQLKSIFRWVLASALGSPWLIQMRISHGRHRPRISVAAIHIRISHGRHRPRISVAAIQIKSVFRCGCLIFWIPNLTFTCFACAGVNEKYHCLHIGDDTPLFGDKNVKDMKDAHAVDSDEEAPFAPDYKQVKTTGRDAQPLCIGRPPDAAGDCPRRTKRVAPVNRRCHQVGPLPSARGGLSFWD